MKRNSRDSPKGQCVGDADGVWHEKDFPERVRSKHFPGTAQQFRAQMQRLCHRCVEIWGWEVYGDERLRQILRRDELIGLWKSSHDDLLGFGEERQREHRAANSQEAPNLPGHLPEPRDYVDVTPPTRSTWAVFMLARERIEEGPPLLDEHGEDTGWVRARVRREKEPGYAGIEAYEQHDGTLVYFLDGYDPGMAMYGIPYAVLPPIGPPFAEFCDWVIQEVWDGAEDPHKLTSLYHQLNDKEKSLQLIEERIAEFVISTDVPLQLVREKRQLLESIEDLKRRIKELERPASGELG